MATSRSLGTLTLDLIARTGGFTEGMSRAERSADRSQRNISRQAKQRAKETEEAWTKATDSIGRVLGVIGAAIAGGALFQRIATETANAQKEQALLAAALRATGNAAGFSQGRLNEMASALEGITTFSAGEFNQAQTVLSGFVNITGDQFPKAMMAAADFATRMGVSVASAAETMGRALDIPSVGMRSLQRQGFQFKDSQIALAQEMERTGRLAEAQQMVLEALNETYGGSAVAARDTLGGAYTALQNTINSLLTGDEGSFKELQQSIDGLTGKLQSAEAKDAFATFTKMIADLATAAVDASVHFVNFGRFLGEALGRTLHGSDNPIERLTENINEAQVEVDKLEKALSRATGADPRANAARTGRLKELQDQIAGWEAARNDFIKAANNAPPPVASSNPNAPDLTPTNPGRVNLKDGEPKGPSQQQRAAEQFLRTLQEQVNRTQERTAYEKLFSDIQLRGLKLSEDQLNKAIGLATAIDMAAEAERIKANNVARSNALFEDQERLNDRAQQYELTLSAYGMGNPQAERIKERIELLQEQQRELRKLQNEQANAVATARDEDAADRAREAYEKRIEIIREGQEAELRLFDDFNAKKAEKDQDWILGVQNAVNTYIDEATNVYQQADRAMTQVFSSMEDALVNFVMTGKASFSDFANSVIADLARIAARQAVAGIAGSLFSGVGSTLSGLFGGGRANGGMVSPGKLYEVNERGMEMLTVGGKDYLMTGSQAGYVTPNAAMQGSAGAGGGLTVNIPIAIDANGGGAADPSKLQAVGAQLSRVVRPAVQDEVARMMRPGGLLWNR